jgi:hypothetical protein
MKAISAVRDANHIPAIIGTLDSDGVTVVAIKINPANNAIKTIDATTGSSFSTAVNAQQDANRVDALWGISSADGITPVYIAVDVNGNLLIQST